MREIWKPIPGYPFYEASSLGNIRSLRRKKCHILKPSKDHRGYFQVGLYRDGKLKCFRVHRLVYSAFNGPIPDGYEVNHINEVKTDNRLCNLNLMTHKENINWGTGQNRSAKKRINGLCSTPVSQYTLDGQLVASYPSQQEAARVTGFSRGNISSCCHGRLKQHRGFLWVFSN